MRNVILLLLMIGGISCESKHILFRDNFEGHTFGEVPQAPWEKAGAGAVRIDTAKRYSGRQSVHFTSGEGYKNRALIGLSHIFPVPDNQYYGSLQLYVTKAAPDGIHWTMIQSAGKVPGKNYRSEVRYGGQHQQQLMANYETMGVASDCWQHSSVKIPEGEWCTLKWFFDGNTNTMKLWLNGSPVEEITVTGSGQGCVSGETQGQWNFPVFEDVFIGWGDYQTGGGTRDVWIDDVKIWTVR